MDEEKQMEEDTNDTEAVVKEGNVEESEDTEEVSAEDDGEKPPLETKLDREIDELLDSIELEEDEEEDDDDE